MPTGVEHAREILQDLACPACQYNLRGLRGEVVSCPECGARSDVAKLMQARWQIPWRKAPGYNRLAYPLAWLVLTGVPTVIHHFSYDMLFLQTPRHVYYWTLGGVAIMLAGWVLVMVRTHRREGGTDATFKALQAHVAYGAYMLSVVAFVTAAGTGLEFLGRLSGTVRIIPIVAIGGASLVAGLLAATMGYLGHRGERAIGHWCIRRFIARQSGLDTTDPASIAVSPREAMLPPQPLQPPPMTPALRDYLDKVQRPSR